MPFTFSHPAIVLPLKLLPNKYFSLTGLVIGSMAPDFEYFLRMKIQSNYSHTISGIFWFDLPLTILLAFAFHNIARNSFFDNLPIFRSRFKVYEQFDWNEYFGKHFLVFIYSAIIGIASHLFWDSFTHNHGYFVEIIPFLQNLIFDIPGYKILQHLSSLIGATIIFYTVWKMKPEQNQNAKINYKYWFFIFAFTLIFVVIRFSVLQDFRNYGNAIVSFISSFLLSLIITPLLIKNGR